MARCSFHLLGSMQVTLDGRLLQGLESAKVRALLAFLAVERDQAHERERLAGLFWPEMGEAQARRCLNQSLYNIRQAFGEAGHTGSLSMDAGRNSPYLLVTPHSVQFNPLSDYELDVQGFTHRLDEVQRHGHRGDICEACARLLEEAEQRYQGDFLTGMSLGGCQVFEEWALVWRERLRLQVCQVMSDLISYYEGQDDLRAGLVKAQRWVQLDPFSEAAQVKLMRLLALDGQRTQALAHYMGYSRLLQAEMGVEPGRLARQLYERILAEEEVQTNLPGLPGGVPVSLTPFIGRVKELADLTAWLRDPGLRLITLLGPGGSGKTRLALQAARGLRYDYPDGIFLVSLSGLGSSEAFLPVLARTLGMVLHPQWGDPFEQIVGYLQHRSLLLILDSFEEVPAAVQWVARLLQAVPHIRLLVTSRARLNLQSEQVFPLEGMHYPDPASLAGAPAALEDYSALQLFHSTARQVRPGYAHTADDLPHLVRICQLVAGMPLGLVLAANWLETCTPAEIAAEIERSLDFLSSSFEDVPERQRSMRATLDYSWRLLEEEDRVAFQRVSVFQGAFTRQAAAQVAQVSAGGLRHLVDKSMLQAGQGSYRMHDLLRQYAAEKLAESPGENRWVREAHCKYFLEGVAASESRLKSAQRRAVLGELDAQISDIQAAWRWACQQADLPQLARSLEGLGVYYQARLRFCEGDAACQAGLEALPGGPELSPEGSLLRPRLMLWRESFLVALGQLEDGRQLRQQAGILFDQLEAQQVDVRLARAVYWRAEGDAQADLKTKLEHYENSLLCYRQMGETWRLAYLLSWSGEIYQRRGDLERCWQYQHEALQLARQVGEPDEILACLRHMVFTNFLSNRVESAQQQMREVMEFAETSVDAPNRAYTQMILGVQLDWAGRFAEAIELLERALPLLRSLGNHYGVVFGTMGLGAARLHSGEFYRAEEIIRNLIPLAEQGGFVREAVSGYIILGMAVLALGRPAQAVEHFQESVRGHREMQYKPELGLALGGLALALEMSGQPEEARSTLLEALGLAAQTRNVFPLMTCLVAMVFFLARYGHPEAALQVHRLALRQPIEKVSHWYAALVGDEMNDRWDALSEAQRSEIDASIRQHTPFTIIEDILPLLQ